MLLVLGSLWQDIYQCSKNMCLSNVWSPKHPLPSSQTPPPHLRTEELSSSTCYLPTKTGSTERLIFILFIYFLKENWWKAPEQVLHFFWHHGLHSPGTKQHSKGLWDEKLIPKPTGKGKRFERFRCDLLLELERKFWSPGSAAILCLWLSRWYYIDDCGCKLIDATFLINLDYLAKA